MTHFYRNFINNKEHKKLLLILREPVKKPNNVYLLCY